VPAEPLHVEVVYCPRPGLTDAVSLALAQGSTLADALRGSGLLERHGLGIDAVKAGVWSQVRDLQSRLREGDRVEIYRPLVVDPKEARRLRYKSHKRAKTL
jgi:uncharacterized protein